MGINRKDVEKERHRYEKTLKLLCVFRSTEEKMQKHIQFEKRKTQKTIKVYDKKHNKNNVVLVVVLLLCYLKF